MTEIQAIIDKLEAEYKVISDLSTIEPYTTLYSSTFALLTTIKYTLDELKKHLPKEDKSSFEVETSDGENTIRGFIGHDKDYGIIIRENKTQTVCKFACVSINKKNIPTVIAALQAAHEEMKDE